MANEFTNVMITATSSPLNEVFSCINETFCFDHGFLIDAPALPWLMQRIWNKVGNITLPLQS
jgi:hypothetical protein